MAFDQWNGCVCKSTPLLGSQTHHPGILNATEMGSEELSIMSLGVIMISTILPLDSYTHAFWQWKKTKYIVDMDTNHKLTS